MELIEVECEVCGGTGFDLEYKNERDSRDCHVCEGEGSYFTSRKSKEGEAPNDN